MNKKYISALFLTILCMVIIYPLVITISNSFMDANDITSNYSTSISIFDTFDHITRKFITMSIIPRKLYIGQYINTLLLQPSFLILLCNSIKITFPVVIGNLIISLATAYGFVIWKWKYKEILFYIYIIVMLMPLQAVLVPNYIIAYKLHINNSYLAIILPGIFSPFGTFLLRKNMEAIPIECFEASKIDGASSVSTFLYVIVPQIRSSISALLMLVFIEYWNIVEQSIIFIKEYYRQPLSVYLAKISVDKIDIIFSASCIYMIPPLIFLIFGQQDLEKGIELSGIK